MRHHTSNGMYTYRKVQNCTVSLRSRNRIHRLQGLEVCKCCSSRMILDQRCGKSSGVQSYSAGFFESSASSGSNSVCVTSFTDLGFHLVLSLALRLHCAMHSRQYRCAEHDQHQHNVRIPNKAPRLTCSGVMCHALNSIA